MSNNSGFNPRGRGGHHRGPSGGSSYGGERGYGRGAPRGRGSDFRGGHGHDRGRSSFGGGGRGGPPGIFQEHTPAVVPQRLADTNLSSLISGFNKLQISPERPARPGFGKLGTPIKLRANFFAVKVPKGPIYDYVVNFDPALPDKKNGRERIKRSIFEAMEKHPQFMPHLSYIAHDKSQRVVAARKLPQPLIISVTIDDEPGQATSALPAAPQKKQGKQGKPVKGGGQKKGPKTFAVNIEFERQLDMNRLNDYLDGKPQSRGSDILPMVGALNLVLQQHAYRTGIRVGRQKQDGSEKYDNKYFFPSSVRQRLLPGLEAVQGFYASVRLTYKELTVNLNVCCTAFYEARNLAAIMLDLLKESGGLPDYPPGKVKIRTKHLNRTKPIKVFGRTSARNTYFKCDDPAVGSGGEVSVETYFLKKYQIRLKHATDLPVVDIASVTKPEPAWVPAELCDVEPGQSYKKKLSGALTAKMIKFACNPPRINADAIVGAGFNFLGYNPPMNPSNAFGVSVDNSMAVIPGRELPPPQLSYKSGKLSVRGGSWNIMDVKFHRGASATNWWVIVVRDGEGMIQGPEDPGLRDLTSKFMMKCQQKGMNMPKSLPRLIPVSLPSTNQREDPRRQRAITILRNTIQSQVTQFGKPNFALVLLEKRDDYIYPAIKKIGDTVQGMHTIHFQLEKALDQKKQDQYLANVSLKVNTKLGGVNHLLDPAAMAWLTKEKTMLVGIDVTHPGFGSKPGTPSIAAVVASIDDNFVQFPASLRIQESKKEMLSELTDMLAERLVLYEKINKGLPKRVFVFRDGVSEGQYDDVIQKEMPQIETAFKKFSGGPRRVKYEPRLSIVVCGKRHNARFFPEKSEFADRNGNTRPGTVVDKGITAIFDFDFYLQAHAGLQGTVKATHYIVVYDQNKWQADEIQQGTHTASYLYVRATKAVSLIPPAYYADLACERGRCYLNNFLVDNASLTSGTSKTSDEEKKRVFEAAKKEWGKGLHEDIKDTMFYI